MGDETIVHEDPAIKLPLRDGGMGLRKVEEISPIAYYASVATAASWLGKHVPDLSISRDQLKEPMAGSDRNLEGVSGGMPLLVVEA